MHVKIRTVTDLSNRYQQGVKLSGVLYFHRISDRRMGGIAIRNFSMFRGLCGDDSLKNVAIITNMWGDVDEKTGLEREQELRTQDDFFKPALDQKANMLRNHDTTGCAHEILRRFLDNRPSPLKIQVETVDEKKELCDTSAGIQVNMELREQADRHRRELEQLRRDMEGIGFISLISDLP